MPPSSRDKNLKSFGTLHKFSLANVYYAIFSHVSFMICLGVLKRKKASSPEHALKSCRSKINKSQLRLPVHSFGYIFKYWYAIC